MVNRSELEERQAKRGKRVLLVVVSLFLAVNAAVLYRVLVSPPLSYRGSTVTEWCETINAREPPPEVVNAFGPAAAPELVRLVCGRPPAMQRFRANVWSWVPPWLQRALVLVQPKPVDSAQMGAVARAWLRELGPDAERVVPRLIEMLETESDLTVRGHLVFLLAGMRPAGSKQVVPVLVRLLESPSSNEAQNAASALGMMGPLASEAAGPLEAYLRREMEKSQGKVFYRLGDAAAVPTILEAMKRRPAIREGALSNLLGMGTNAVAAVPELIEILESTDVRQRIEALDLLGRIGPLAQPALAAAERSLTNTNEIARILAAVAVANIRQDPGLAVPLLVEALNDSEPDPDDSISRRRSGTGFRKDELAAWYLGEIGPAADAALPALERMLNGPGDVNRVLAGRAIWRITGDTGSVLPVLRLTIQSETAGDRALSVLEEMGPAGKDLGDALVAMIEDRSRKRSERRRALEVLGKVDPDRADGISL